MDENDILWMKMIKCVFMDGKDILWIEKIFCFWKRYFMNEKIFCVFVFGIYIL